MKASDLIALKLSQYTDYVFSGQGGSVVHILDSLYKRKGIKLIPSQNEQGASLAADAYTRTSGKLGIVVTTCGPGTINALRSAHQLSNIESSANVAPQVETAP